MLKKPSPEYTKRRERVLKELHNRQLRNLLVTSPYNVTYLTGFTGEDSFLYISNDEVFLLSDGRYEEQIKSECKGIDLVLRASSMTIIDAAAQELGKRPESMLNIESTTTSLAQWERLNSLTPTKQWQSCSGVVERLREIKDSYELELIEQSISIAERAYRATRELLHDDLTEKQIAYDIETGIRRLGGDGSAFKTIVGVGERSALPHGRPSEKRVGESSFVLIDWGAKYNLYLSDLTRVVITGKPPAKLERIYRSVWRAQQAAIEMIRPGISMSTVDLTARKVLADAGLEKRFTHGLGHSFGLEIHETVRLGKGQDRPLEAGMVITVEPGVYFPGFGGVRIEDDVLVTEDGHRILTSAPKNWEDIRR